MSESEAEQFQSSALQKLSLQTEIDSLADCDLVVEVRTPHSCTRALNVQQISFVEFGNILLFHLKGIAQCCSCDCVCDCEYVFVYSQAIVENMEIKLPFYQQLGARVKPEAIFASNTSSLPVTEMALASGRADRFVCTLTHSLTHSHSQCDSVIEAHSVIACGKRGRGYCIFCSFAAVVFMCVCMCVCVLAVGFALFQSSCNDAVSGSDPHVSHQCGRVFIVF